MNYQDSNFNNVCVTFGTIVHTDYGFMGSDPYFSLNTDIHFKCTPQMADYVRSTFIATGVPAKITFYLPAGRDPHALGVDPVEEKTVLEYTAWCRQVERQY